MVITDKRKLCGKWRKKLKPGEKRKSFQEFIDDIGRKAEEKEELEDLFKRVLILKSESVLEEMEIRKKNNAMLKARLPLKTGEREINNAGGGAGNNSNNNGGGKTEGKDKIQ